MRLLVLDSLPLRNTKLEVFFCFHPRGTIVNGSHIARLLSHYAVGVLFANGFADSPLSAKVWFAVRYGNRKSHG